MSFGDKRIRSFQKENSGVSDTRNYGLRKATGEWILFVDSDDELKKEALSIIVENITDCEWLIFGYETFPEKTIHTVKVPSVYKTYQKIIPDYSALNTLQLFNVPWNKVFKRKVIINSKLQYPTDLSLGEDLLFNLSYMKACKQIKVIPDILYRYRQESDASLSAIFRKDIFDVQRILKEAVDNAFGHSYLVEKETRKDFVNYLINEVKKVVLNKKLCLKDKISLVTGWIQNDYFQSVFRLVDMKDMNFGWDIIFAAKHRQAWLMYFFFLMHHRSSILHR